MSAKKTEVVQKLEGLVDSIIQNAKNARSSRYMIGICGYPGAGKTTLSARLSAGINTVLAEEAAAVVPMDGFHLSNSVLDELNLRPLKGIPATFDANGFVSALEKLRKTSTESVYLPLFDRSIEGSIENGIEIKPCDRILIVEGNYLLLQTPPWDKVKPLLDEVIFLDTAFDIIESRLLERHILGGKTPEEARAKMESTDLPNARLIESTRELADRVFKL